jgi:CRISPR/Cas system CSM-associated protein Csm2 small subunit
MSTPPFKELSKYTEQHINLVNGKYAFKKKATRKIYYALLKRCNFRSQGDTEEIVATVEEVMGKLPPGKKRAGRAYEDIKEGCQELVETVFHLEKINDKTHKRRYLGIPLMERCEYGEGEATIKAKFNKSIMPYYQAIAPYVREDIELLEQLSYYSDRLYMMLKEKADYSDRVLTKAELQEKFVMGDAYPRFTDFTKFIIKPAVKEMRERTRMSFEWKAVKRGGGYYAYQFTNITEATFPILQGSAPDGLVTNTSLFQEAQIVPYDHSKWREALNRCGIEDEKSLDRIQAKIMDASLPDFDEGYIHFSIYQANLKKQEMDIKSFNGYLYKYIIEGYWLKPYSQKKKKQPKAPGTGSIFDPPASSAAAAPAKTPAVTAPAEPATPTAQEWIPFCSDREMHDSFDKFKATSNDPSQYQSIEEFITLLAKRGQVLILGKNEREEAWWFERKVPIAAGK